MFTLHVFSDGKRVLSTDEDLSPEAIHRISDVVAEAGDRPLVMGDGFEVAEHAYPLGDWKDIEVRDTENGA